MIRAGIYFLFIKVHRLYFIPTTVDNYYTVIPLLPTTRLVPFNYGAIIYRYIIYTRYNRFVITRFFQISSLLYVHGNLYKHSEHCTDTRVVIIHRVCLRKIFYIYT